MDVVLTGTARFQLLSWVATSRQMREQAFCCNSDLEKNMILGGMLGFYCVFFCFLEITCVRARGFSDYPG